MCGIAGCYQQADGHKLVEIMTDRIAHRGPDAAGIWDHDDDRVTAQLGHRRLSIIDLSTAADQPLSKDGLTLVYNGELYNYRSCGPNWSLAASGSSPKSDTEVVLEAWRSWGRGPCGGSAACSRSRCSTSAPVSWSWRGTRWASSRCTTFRVAMAWCSPRSSRRWWRRSAPSCGSDPGPGGVDALLLGARAAVRDRRRAEASRRVVGELRPDGTLPVRHYWRVADVAAEAAAGPPADLRPVIEESVAAHLVSDVPVSSFLSGGLDSSIVTVLAHRANHGIDAYTITFRPEDQRLEAMPDDAVYARKVAARYGIGCTRSRSRPTSWTCCPASSTCSTSRSATRPRSTRCSCARRRASAA